jgi:hypothetical protein
MSDGPATEEHVHPVARAVADLETMLGECAGLPLWSLRDKDIDDLVPQAYSLLGRVMGNLVLPLVREADRRDLATAFDAGNTAGWVRDVLRVTSAEARRIVGLAKAVDGDLAATGQALADGRISTEHAQVIARSVAELPEEAAQWVPAAAERDLLGMAEQYDPHVLAKLGRRILTVVDPDRGDEILGRQLERQDKAAKSDVTRRSHGPPRSTGADSMSGSCRTRPATRLRPRPALNRLSFTRSLRIIRPSSAARSPTRRISHLTAEPQHSPPPVDRMSARSSA